MHTPTVAHSNNIRSISNWQGHWTRCMEDGLVCRPISTTNLLKILTRSTLIFEIKRWNGTANMAKCCKNRSSWAIPNRYSPSADPWWTCRASNCIGKQSRQAPYFWPSILRRRKSTTIKTCMGVRLWCVHSIDSILWKSRKIHWHSLQVRYVIYAMLGVFGYGLSSLITDFFNFQHGRKVDIEMANLGPGKSFICSRHTRIGFNFNVNVIFSQKWLRLVWASIRNSSIEILQSGKSVASICTQQRATRIIYFELERFRWRCGRLSWRANSKSCEKAKMSQRPIKKGHRRLTRARNKVEFDDRCRLIVLNVNPEN